MISEPDNARLRKIAQGSLQSPLLSDGELDAIPDEQMDAAVKKMAKAWYCWKVIVTPSEKRTKDWWVRGMMTYFKNGLSLMDLEDGRLAICTWSVSR